MVVVMVGSDSGCSNGSVSSGGGSGNGNGSGSSG